MHGLLNLRLTFSPAFRWPAAYRFFGDAGPDAIIRNDGRIFDKSTLTAAQEFYRYSEKKELRDAALQTAAQMLQNMPADYSYGEADLVSHIRSGRVY